MRYFRATLAALAGGTALLAAATPAWAAPGLSVSPSEGLSDGEVIAVTGSGFSSAAALVLIQCADPADPDQGVAALDRTAHCNGDGTQELAADGGGHVSTDFPVSAGPFGTAGIVCDSDHDCLLVLATAGDAERAEATIMFGAGTVGPIIGPIGGGDIPIPTPTPAPPSSDPGSAPVTDDPGSGATGDPSGPAASPAESGGAAPDVTAAATTSGSRASAKAARPRLAATGRAEAALAATGLALMLAGLAMVLTTRRPEEA